MARMQIVMYQNLDANGNPTVAANFLQYNTMTYTQQPVYDTDGRSLMYFAVNYAFTGKIQAGAPDALIKQLETLRHNLGQPRGQLVVVEGYDPAAGKDQAVDIQHAGGLVLVNTYDVDSPTYEVNYGPIPGAFVVEKITGGMSADWRWDVTVNQRKCGLDQSAVDKVIEGLTFSTVYTVDQDGFTTRTVSGKLTVAKNGTPADNYRDTIGAMFAPPGGYWRTISQVYGMSEDTRVLSFDITHQQRWAALPPPVTSGEATYSVSYNAAGRVLNWTLAGRFTAGNFPPGGGKADMWNQAIILGQSRIHPEFDGKKNNVWYGANDPKTGRPTVLGCVMSSEWNESVYDNSITFRFSGIRRWEDEGGLPTKMFTDPPNSDNQARIPPRGYDDGSNGTTVVYRKNPVDPCDSPSTLTVTGGGYVPGGNGYPQPIDPASGSGGSSTPAPANGGNSQTQYNGPTADPKTGIPYDPRTLPGASTSSPTGTNSTGNPDTQATADLYVSFNEVYSFEFRSGKVVLLPMVRGVAPFVQQASASSLIIVQSGYYVTQGGPTDAPSPANPMYGPAEVVMLQHSIIPEIPRELNQGVLQFKVSWRYVMQYILETPTTALCEWPSNPTTNTPPELPNVILPEVDAIAKEGTS